MPDPIHQPRRFRLRFRVAKLLASSAQELGLTNLQLSRPVSLRASTCGAPIGESNWLIASSRGYPSDAEACQNGQLLKDALLLSGAQCGIGIDVGQDRATTSFSQVIKDTSFRETGVLWRDDIFGLDVFDDVEVAVLSANLELKASADPGTFVRSFGELASLVPFMDERSRTSAQLINDALFPLTPETRLVVLMTAIESLWPSPKRSETVCALANALLLHLDSLESSETDKEDVRGRIAKIQTSSIGSLCRENISRLLGPERAKEFRQLYQARSRFAHDGKGRAVLHAEGDLAQRLALDTLLAELRSRAG
jgi:hypothetical protein